MDFHGDPISTDKWVVVVIYGRLGLSMQLKRMAADMQPAALGQMTAGKELQDR